MKAEEAVFCGLRIDVARCKDVKHLEERVGKGGFTKQYVSYEAYVRVENHAMVCEGLWPLYVLIRSSVYVTSWVG